MNPLLLFVEWFVIGRNAFIVCSSIQSTSQSAMRSLVEVDGYIKILESSCSQTQSLNSFIHLISGQVQVKDETSIEASSHLSNYKLDQGRNFDSTLMQEIYGIMGIKKSHTTAYHPQGDGQVERQNRTLQEIIGNFVSENQYNWDQWEIREYLHTTQVYILQQGSLPMSLSLVVPLLCQ